MDLQQLFCNRNLSKCSGRTDWKEVGALLIFNQCCPLLGAAKVTFSHFLNAHFIKQFILLDIIKLYYFLLHWRGWCLLLEATAGWRTQILNSKIETEAAASNKHLIVISFVGEKAPRTKMKVKNQKFFIHDQTVQKKLWSVFYFRVLLFWASALLTGSFADMLSRWPLLCEHIMKCFSRQCWYFMDHPQNQKLNTSLQRYRKKAPCFYVT